jgi:hypothetical protein
VEVLVVGCPGGIVYYCPHTWLLDVA